MSQPVATRQLPGGLRLVVSLGDLTETPLDAIVNAANPRLQHGGGLAAAIVRRGGALIQQESDAWVRDHGPASPEHPALTAGGRLPARHVIHAVGPVWGEGDEDRKLETAVLSSLEAARRLGVSSLGLPAISTGIYRFPLERAAPIIVAAVATFASRSQGSSLRHVEIVLFDQDAFDLFARAAATVGEPVAGESGDPPPTPRLP